MDRRRFLRTLGVASAAAAGYMAGLVRPLSAEPIPCDMTLSGDFAGTIPAGETWLLDGDLNLTGDLIVEGVLVARDEWEIVGNGFQVMAQHGGRLDLAGVEKSGWVRWGDTPTGWQVGDRLAVAPMSPGEFDPVEVVWGGSWAATSRPSPDVTLRDGRVMRPEVANLSRSGVVRDVSRVMFHHGAGVQTLKHLSVVDSGVAGQLDFYPTHFHLTGDASRGSLLEGVVVENGRNHAFVPHGSHGVTYRDCVAYGVEGDAWWWNTPSAADFESEDNAHDLVFDRCLVMAVDAGHGFRLAGGEGGRMVGCAAAGNYVRADRGGVHWRHGTGVWDFDDFVAHNNYRFGVAVWQNQSQETHLLTNLVSFNNLGSDPSGPPTGRDYDHGAYGNLYHYRDFYGGLFVLHANSEEGEGLHLTLERADLEELLVVKHASYARKPSKVIDSSIGRVRYFEQTADKRSWIEYVDCGLTPADFVLEAVADDTIIEIYEAGTLAHRWASGSWN